MPATPISPRASSLRSPTLSYSARFQSCRDRTGSLSRVGATDVLLARNNQTSFLSALKLIDLSAEETPSAAEPLAELAWLYEAEQSTAGNAASKPAAPAVAGVDLLLAAYWP